MNHENLEHALSLERFNRYLEWASDNRDKAIALYSLNTRISECLYTPLQTLEVVLRNRIHFVLAAAKGDLWYENREEVTLGRYQPQQIEKVIEGLRRDRKPITPGRVIAGLTFSFWTAMFSKHHEALWQQELHQISDPSAPKGLKRKSFTGPLTEFRRLRNRIAHHEPILGWNLPKHHDDMLRIIGWLSPVAQEWCLENDRFPEVHPGERIQLARPAG